MTKAAELAKVSAKGGLHFLWGLVISTVISSVGTIFVARLLGSNEYGLYGVVFAVPNLIMIFREWGVDSAMIWATARFRAEGRSTEIRNIFFSGLAFEIISGLLLFMFSFAFSGVFAGTVYNRPEIAPLLQIASLAILAGGLTRAATAVFVGTEKMHYNSVMLVVQSIIKTILMMALVLFGFGASGAVISLSAATSVAGIIGLLLVWVLYRELPKQPGAKLELIAYTKMMFKYGVPLSLSTLISGFLMQFYTFLLPMYYTENNTMIGNYVIAMNFMMLISFFSGPIKTMLFPAFSKLDPEKDKQALQNVFRFSVKYSSLLVIPVAALVMSVSQPAISALFGETYQSAPLFLILLAVSQFYVGFGSLANNNFINSRDETTYNLRLVVVTAAVGFPMGTILILNFGVFGLLFTTLTSGLPSLFMSLQWMKKKYGLTIDWVSSGKIILASSTAAVLTYLLLTQVPFNSWVKLAMGVLIFAVIFIAAILFTKAIDKTDIANLREMTNSFGILSKIINRFMDLIERIMDILGM